MPGACVRLFVYGSLKRDGRHHQELAGARFLGLAETAAGYRLEALGDCDYLALVPATGPGGAGSTTVTGELFEVDEARLPALDAFEGDAYYRAELEVQVLGGENDAQRAQTGEQFTKRVFALAYLKNAD